MGEVKQYRVAILDMNKGLANQGIRGIKDILNDFNTTLDSTIIFDLFEVREKVEIPDLSYDAYISSGGPGSPFDGLGTEWEEKYFEFLGALVSYNETHSIKKYALLICHSFQLACRKFELAKVIPRYSNAFGVFPVFLTNVGLSAPIFNSLSNPFYALDSRDWQVIDPDWPKMEAMGAKILAIEKERPQVNFERCIMAVQFTNEIIGTQFHPEADPVGLRRFLGQSDKKEIIVSLHSKEKYENIIESLSKPERIKFTQETILPNFLNLMIKRKS